MFLRTSVYSIHTFTGRYKVEHIRTLRVHKFSRRTIVLGLYTPLDRMREYGVGIVGAYGLWTMSFVYNIGTGGREGRVEGIKDDPEEMVSTTVN